MQHHTIDNLQTRSYDKVVRHMQGRNEGGKGAQFPGRRITAGGAE